MGIKDAKKKFDRAAAAAAIVTTVNAAPTPTPVNTPTTHSGLKSLVEREAADRASRMRSETTAKGSRSGWSGKGK